jgi:hypothetical protein
MNTLFDSAGLAIVAYAEVRADGSSPSTNSGIGTSKVPSTTGQYAITLPSGKVQGSATLDQYPRDLVIVNPIGLNPTTVAADPTNIPNADGSGTFHVNVYSGGTLADGQFSILILRTVLPTPAGNTAT